MNTKLKELKKLCNEQAELLSQQTIEIKTLQKAGKYAGQVQSSREFNKRQYRRLHIAECLLRGKVYEQIENPKHDCKKLTSYDWEKIENIRKEYYEQSVAETVCALS